MATIQQIKDQNNANIRVKTAPSSIKKNTDANMRDVVANELRDRGVIQMANTASLAAQSRLNTRMVLVYGVGLFIAVETVDDPDGITFFPSLDDGWLWQKAMSTDGAGDVINIDGPSVIPITDGFLIEKIYFKNLGGDAQTIMVSIVGPGLDDVWNTGEIAAGAKGTISYDIPADGDPVVLYITVSQQTKLVIYKRSL